MESDQECAAQAGQRNSGFVFRHTAHQSGVEPRASVGIAVWMQSDADAEPATHCVWRRNMNHITTVDAMKRRHVHLLGNLSHAVLIGVQQISGPVAIGVVHFDDRGIRCPAVSSPAHAQCTEIGLKQWPRDRG